MLDDLMNRLGYVFRDASLLLTALTHRSKSPDHNERLEFLGDAVVNFIAGEALFNRYSNASEGELSRWRATLINRDTLAELAQEFQLSAHLNLGQGEIKSGGLTRSSILSCAMEAVIGAIYLDSDFSTTRACVLSWYESRLNDVGDVHSHKDPKTRLQEYAQSKLKTLPIYTVEQVDGEAHQHVFTVSCALAGHKVTGQGSSRRRAEQEAAATLLKEVKHER